MRNLIILILSLIAIMLINIGLASSQLNKQKPDLYHTVILDFKVNEDTDDTYQTDPAISVDGNGNLVICWTKLDEMDPESHVFSETFAQRYNMDGEKQGTNFMISGASASPDIAVGESGNFIICYEIHSEHDYIFIYATRYNSIGVEQEKFRVDDDYITRAKQNPAITVDSNENYLLCWEEERGNCGDIYAQKYNRYGVAKGSNFAVNDNACDALQTYSAIAYDGKGRLIICWIECRLGDSYDIFAQRYTKLREPIGGSFKVNNETMNYETWPNSWHRPAVAADEQGNFIIIWTDNRNGNWDIYAQRYNHNGVAQGTNFKINDDTGTTDQSSPSITADVNGNFVVCWADKRNGNSDIYAQKYVDHGQRALGKNYKVNHGEKGANQRSPDVSLKYGKVYYTWQDDRNSGQGWDIYASVERFIQPDSAYFAEKIPSQSAVPNIDGIIDEEIWNSATEDSLLFGGVAQLWGTYWTDWDDNLIKWKALWSDVTNKLYVAVTIKDDIRGVFDNNDPNETPFNPYQDDTIEFFTNGDNKGGSYEGSFDTAQQWWVTGENKIILDDYPSSIEREIYTGEDLITAVTQGANGDWTCEAEFKIYDTFPNVRKTLTIGDTIGWNIWYNDSDNDNFEDGKYKTDNKTGWLYEGRADKNAEFFGDIILVGVEEEGQDHTFKDVLSNKIDVLSLVDGGTAFLSSSSLEWGNLSNCFDSDSTSQICSANINPAFVQVTFSEQQSVNALRVLLGEPGYPQINKNDWWVEIAQSQSDMDSQTGTYQLIVPKRYEVAGEWDIAILQAAVSSKIWRFNVLRTTQDNYVRIPELELWSSVKFNESSKAVVLIDSRLYSLLQSEIDQYIDLAGTRRGFNILLDEKDKLDDVTFREIHDRIKNYWHLCTNLEGVLCIGNIKLPSFYKNRSDLPYVRLNTAYYEDFDIQLSRHYETGNIDPYCPDSDWQTWTYCQNSNQNGVIVSEHDFDDVLNYPNQPDIWTAYMPVGASNADSYDDFAEQLRPYFEKLFRFYQGMYQPDQGMYMVSNDMFGGAYNFWQLYDHVTKVDYYAMNPSTDCHCLDSGRNIEQCYVRAPLEDYSSFTEFWNNYQSRYNMGENWQDSTIYLPHMRENNYEFVHVNTHSSQTWSIIYSHQANKMQEGGMIMLGSGCSVAGFRQLNSPSNVDITELPGQNILVNYLYGQSNFLAALGAPSLRGHQACFEKLIDYMKNENDYLGKANLRRMKYKYNQGINRIYFKEMLNEILLGDPFLDVAQNGTTLPPSPPAAPSNLEASFNNQNQVELTWTDNSDNERFFKIYRSIDDTVWNYISTSDQNVASFIDKGPFETYTYNYKIRAMNYGGNSDWSYSAKAVKYEEGQFTKITQGDIVNDGSSSVGCSWGDYNSDGYLDLFVANLDNNLLYQNNGDSTFTKIISGPLVNDSGSSWGGSCWSDCDNDGDLDLFVANSGKNLLYSNNGDGTFTKITEGAIINDTGSSHGGTWGDYDSDGDLDLFIANKNDENNFLYVNNNDSTFTKVSSGAIVNDGGQSRNSSWADYDNDGDLDLFVANEMGQNNFLYANNGDGTFNNIYTGSIVNDGGYSTGSSWGDYDNDGDLDLFVTNWNENNFLYSNNGDSTFTKITTGPIVNDGGKSKGSSWGDYDNDGDLDLFVANEKSENNFLYSNNGDSTFTKITTEPIVNNGGWSESGSWGDYDNDGDLDLFVANNYSEDNFLYKNNGNANNWLNIKCVGTVSNCCAIGAIVRIKAAINGHPVWQMRQISGQTGYAGQNSLNAEFGLKDAAVVDSLKVEWPSGIVQVLADVEINQFLTVTEPDETGIVSELEVPSAYLLEQNYPNPFNMETEIVYQLPEPGYVNLSIYNSMGQKILTLISHKQAAGRYTAHWDGRNEKGYEITSGIYIYRLEISKFIDIKKMLLIK